MRSFFLVYEETADCLTNSIDNQEVQLCYSQFRSSIRYAANPVLRLPDDKDKENCR